VVVPLCKEKGTSHWATEVGYDMTSCEVFTSSSKRLVMLCTF